MSDEGPVPDWMPLDRAFDVMCLSLETVLADAQSRRVGFALELHNALTTRPQYLTKLLERFGPAELGVNFDTGNSFLAGNDPVHYLGAVAKRVVHVHIKDIPRSLLAQRGKLTGTRVGVAAGEGVVDVPGIVRLLAAVGYRGALSVECDTLEQARQSRVYLESLTRSVSNPASI
jgi:sugar phosphate isomerase/epimerase